MSMSGPRRIAQRQAGRRHGPITRLISPGELGEVLKPFVFLDYVDADKGPGFGFHPHSGIATLTYPLTFEIEHEASSGQVDRIPPGGVEWVVTGSGIWHRARVPTEGRVRGFQLWLALPPSEEHGEPGTRFLSPAEVPVEGPVSVLLGEYRGLRSSIDSGLAVHCFMVRLGAGKPWSYQPPPSHAVAWAFVQSGDILVDDARVAGELIVFEPSVGPVEFVAETDCQVLVGSAAPHDYPLVLGPHSVHTSPAALSRGIGRIQSIGADLQRRGAIP